MSTVVQKTADNKGIKAVKETIKLLKEHRRSIENMLAAHREDWVVMDANNEGLYAIGVKGDKCMVESGFYPYVFTNKQTAEYCAKGFRCENGKGVITWQVLSVPDYANRTLTEIKEKITQFRGYLS